LGESVIPAQARVLLCFQEFLLGHEREVFRGPRKITSEKERGGDLPSFSGRFMWERKIVVLSRVFIEAQERSLPKAEQNNF